jgi:Putative transmembrane protein (PGPGW)
MLVVVAGFIVTLAGFALLVLPGPALVIIPIGLAMLALEFAWAERALEKALNQAESAKRKASKTSPEQKLLTAAAGVLAAFAFVAAAWTWDIPLLPF